MIGTLFRVNNFFKKKKIDSDGFSLIEVVVSVTLFVIIVMSATEIFRLVIDSQRNAVATQNVQESLKYFLEVTEKEIRMAQRDDEYKCSWTLDNGQVFFLSSNSYGDILRFRNYYGECVIYSLALDGDSQRFQISRDGSSDFISPKKITIDQLRFLPREAAGKQSVVTMDIKAHSLSSSQFRSEMNIQTTLSSRFYRK